MNSNSKTRIFIPKTQYNVQVSKKYSPDVWCPTLSDGLVHQDVNAGLVQTPEFWFEESLSGLEALAPHLKNSARDRGAAIQVKLFENLVDISKKYRFLLSL